MARTRILVCVAGLVLVSVMAMAATKHGVAPSPVGLATIYSNLGPPTDLYTADQDWNVTGSGSPLGAEYWLAMPFRTKQAHIVKQIDVAVGYVTGTNQIVVGLAADKGGLPGKTLHAWTYKNMYSLGTCCTLDTVKYAPGVKLAKGRYWVTVTTNAKDTDLWGGWNFTYNLAEGAFATQPDGGGWQAQHSYVCAFDVLGE